MVKKVISKTRNKNRRRIDNYLNQILFEDAYYNIDRENIDYLIKGSLDSKYSIQLKKILFLLLGLSMPFSVCFIYILGNKNIEMTIFSRSLAIFISLLFILVLSFSYFKSKKMLRNYGYKSFTYTSCKVTYLSYISGSIGTVNDSYFNNVLTILVYILFCLFLYHFVEKNLIIESINDMVDSKYKTSKIFSILFKMSGAFIIVGMIFAQLYRINRWWLTRNSIYEVTNGMNINSIIIYTIGGIGMMILALIPTYLCFNAKLYVENRLVMKYSDEFKEIYGYYSEEWER